MKLFLQWVLRMADDHRVNRTADFSVNQVLMSSALPVGMPGNIRSYEVSAQCWCKAPISDIVWAPEASASERTAVWYEDVFWKAARLHRRDVMQHFFETGDPGAVPLPGTTYADIKDGLAEVLGLG